MRIVVAGARKSGTKNDPHVIASALMQAGHEVDIVTWESLRFTIRTGGVRIFNANKELFVEKIDRIIALGWYKSGRQAIYRDVAFSLGLVAQHKGASVWNSEILQQRSTSKLSCMVQLALAGIDVPPTQFSLESAELVENAPLPFVAKAAAASRGEHNYLISSESERQSVVALSDMPLLLQPFLPNTHDLRIICFGGQPQLALQRSRPIGANTHLNNTSQGATASWVELDELPPEILTNSRKICKIMSREMAGIDFIPDTHAASGYSCLEVNAIPQLTSGFGVETKIEALVRALDKQESENT